MFVSSVKQAKKQEEKYILFFLNKIRGELNNIRGFSPE
jgi:hypothetical protein